MSLSFKQLKVDMPFFWRELGIGVPIVRIELKRLCSEGITGWSFAGRLQLYEVREPGRSIQNPRLATPCFVSALHIEDRAGLTLKHT